MQVGDTVKCADADDMIATMQALAKEGIETDFDYTKKKRAQISSY